ncbi:MAG: DUF892 family protein, partial [Thermoleophilaceae bacterium]
KAEAMPAPGPDVVGEAASAAVGVANRAVAAAKGPLHMIRGTGEQEKMLKNVKTEYWNEFEEIATYSAIEALAETVGDKETAKLARGIRREEERMAKFLERQITPLTKAVAQEEIPAAERRTARRRTARRSSSSSSKSGTRRSSSSSAKPRTRRRSGSSGKAQTRRSTSSGGRRSTQGRARSSGSRGRSGGARRGGRRTRKS